MISCCESTTRVLPYDRFLTRVFKDVGVDLSRETYFEAPSIYDTYDDQDERNFLSKKNSTDVPESEVRTSRVVLGANEVREGTRWLLD